MTTLDSTRDPPRVPSGLKVVRGTLDDVTAPPPRVLGSTREPTMPIAPWARKVLEGSATPRVPTFELHPGLLIPETRCRIVRWIADGGMGVVYEAVHESLGRRIALKVLRPEYSGRPELVQQFNEEARAASRIGSEHIVQVHDFGKLPDGRCFFTMELLPGERLTDSIGTIAIDRLFGVLRQLCKALAVAHDAGIVHRDIKPDNVMLTSRDDRADFVKVLDFGLATMQGADDEAVSNAGTPTYMAPELILGVEFDHRVDMYAVGCAAFELLTGRPPFVDDDPKQVLLGHLERKPPRPSELTSRPIPAALERVILRCLEKSPQNRYADMRALEVALVEAQLESRVYSTWDDLPLPRMDPEHRERIEAELRRGRAAQPTTRRRWLPFAIAGAVLLLGAVGIATAWRSDDHGAAIVDARVEHMVNAARAAAAKANYVYPPADAPSEATAFTRVLELERLDDEGVDEALVHGRALRQEFAATLVRLGDEYWEAEGGRPFAIDYYAQAQLFAAIPAEAAARVSLTPGELASLRHKATESAFTEAELVAAEPLAVLAQRDPQARLEARRRLGTRAERRSASTVERLDQLLPAEPAPAPAPAPVAPPAAAPAPAVSPVVEAPSPVVEPEPPVIERDPQRAASECAAGEAALRAGRIGEAENAFERALGFDRRSARAFIGLSDVHFDRGAYGKAAQWAAKAVGAAPTSAAYRLRLGDAYYKVHRYREAHAAYTKALALGDAAAQGRLDKVNAKLGE